MEAGAMRIGKRAILAVFLVSLFLFMAFAISSYYNSLRLVEVMRVSSPIFDHAFTIYDLVPLIATASLIFGAGIYYLMAGRVEKKELTAKKTAEVVLKFLGEDERAVVKELACAGGSMPQSNLSQIRGLSKVKAHRIAKRLASRGIVVVERHGKTNSITLAQEIKEGLA